jgi:NAD(P)-dependent dehydrogenase (short-subunit alcohol dehydrogenase family)
MVGRVKDKVIVVTGAASGIGLGTVERLIEEGAFVLAADIQDEKGSNLEARFKDRLIYRHCDVTPWKKLNPKTGKQSSTYW